MRNFVVKGLFRGLLALFCVSFLVFLLTTLMPGNYFSISLFGGRISQGRIKELSDLYSFNQPFLTQYFVWLKRVLTLDFGTSFLYKTPAINVIFSYLPTTLLITLTSFLFELIFATFFGVMCALKRDSVIDRTFSALSIVFLCVPSFFLCLLLQLIFVVVFPIFPLSGVTTIGANFGFWGNIFDVLCHILLPCTALTLLQGARLFRYIKSSVFNILHEDYIKLAKMKGLSFNKVLFFHAFPNILIPLIAYISLSVPVVFSGSMVIESIFSIKGIGSIALESVIMRDYPLIMAFTIFIATITIFCNLMGSILLRLFNKRLNDGGVWNED